MWYREMVVDKNRKSNGQWTSTSLVYRKQDFRRQSGSVSSQKNQDSWSRVWSQLIQWQCPLRSHASARTPSSALSHLSSYHIVPGLCRCLRCRQSRCPGCLKPCLLNSLSCKSCEKQLTTNLNTWSPLVELFGEGLEPLREVHCFRWVSEPLSLIFMHRWKCDQSAFYSCHQAMPLLPL